MSGKRQDLVHILFFPGFAPGHMIPMVSLAKLFAAAGALTTILTTPANAPTIRQLIAGPTISLHVIPFPSAAAGLPEHCENFSTLPHHLHRKLLQSLPLLRTPFRDVVRDLLPDCVVTDVFLPWTYEVAAEFSVPRIAFHGSSFFSMCVFNLMVQLLPLEGLPLGTQSFKLPSMPHNISMLVSQTPDFLKKNGDGSDLFKHICDTEGKSYGVVVNSFAGLEQEYVTHYREVIGRKAWRVGPLFLANNNNMVEVEDSGSRADHACLKWLDKKPPRSVVYVCFGSVSTFTRAQLREMAGGLEDCGREFLWVVGSGGGGEEQWIPEGFDERVGDRGLVIRGWAPQPRILGHAAIGGFLTHCGWNSVLEAVAGGVPVLTWPLFADQFYNERLLVDVLKIGVEIGVLECHANADERVVVSAGSVAAGLRRLMGEGDAAEERRRRVRELGDKAREAVAVGGSSYEDARSLMKELVERKAAAVAERERNGVSGEAAPIRLPC